MNNLKILILSPSTADESLGIMYISAGLKKAGFTVKGELLSKFLENLKVGLSDTTKNEEDFFKIFEEYNPNVVLYSVNTGEHTECLSLNKKLKEKKDFISIFGGPHITFFPETINEKGVDIVGIGECDEAIVELITKIANNEDITNVKNFWIKKDNKIYKNGVRPLISNLDSIPFPDRELFVDYKQNKEYSLITSRGCPYGCTYCYSKPFKELYCGEAERFVRFRSTDNIIKELKELKKTKDIKDIKFYDSIFIMNMERLRKFTKKYKEEIDLPFVCSVRANFVTEEVVKLIKEAGCKQVFMGVEAGSDSVRLNLLKRDLSKKQMLDARNLLQKGDILVFAQNMIGLPTTTINDDFETLEFNIELKPDFAWVSIFTPYPGTPLGELCIKEKLIENFDDLYSTYHYKSKLNLPHKNQVNILHKLFSLTTDYPYIFPRIKQMVLNSEKCNFEKLHKLARVYRVYKYKKVLNQNLELPKEVNDFIKNC